MAGLITSSSFSKALYPGVSSWFGNAYNELPTQWTDLFQTYSSSRATEEDVEISSFGLAQRKYEGQAISMDDETQLYTTRYAHVVYGLGFVITREMVEDDLYDVIAPRKANALAFSMRQTKEIVGANVYNRAFNSSYVGGDGVSMINSAHPLRDGGTQSNTLAVQADLSEASLEQACIDLQKMTNNRGLRIAVMPQTLILPVDLAFEADRILNSSLRAGTANNDKNAIMGKFPGGVKTNQYLTDSDAWFIRTNIPNSLKHYQRRGMEFTSDNDHDTENAKYKATERYSFGWTDYLGIFGSQGAA